jgi:hypothetical protein
LRFSFPSHEPTPAPVSLLPLLIFLFFVYLLPSLFLYLVANKSKTKGGWLAWIPVARLLLLCRMGRISPWWSLTAMIPVLGIVALFVLCYHMPKCLGVRWQRRLLAAIPVVGFFYIGYLAFHYKPALDAEGRVAGAASRQTPRRNPSDRPLSLCAIPWSYGSRWPSPRQARRLNRQEVSRAKQACATFPCRGQVFHRDGRNTVR